MRASFVIALVLLGLTSSTPVARAQDGAAAPPTPVATQPVPPTPVATQPVPPTPAAAQPVPPPPVYTQPVPAGPAATQPVPIAPAYTQSVPIAPQAMYKEYYGWQVILLDVSSMVLLVAHDNTAPVGAGGYLLGGPIVHAVRGNTGTALASAGLRVGLPLAGILIGASLYESSSEDDGGVFFGGVISALAGGALGALGAIVIDWSVLSWDERPITAERSMVLVPQVGLGEHGVSLGVAGSF